MREMDQGLDLAVTEMMYGVGLHCKCRCIVTWMGTGRGVSVAPIVRLQCVD